MDDPVALADKMDELESLLSKGLVDFIHSETLFAMRRLLPADIKVLYVGEGRRGANASDGFFDRLELGWECVKIVELDPFPQCFERLFVLRRRAPAPGTGRRHAG